MRSRKWEKQEAGEREQGEREQKGVKNNIFTLRIPGVHRRSVGVSAVLRATYQ